MGNLKISSVTLTAAFTATTDLDTKILTVCDPFLIFLSLAGTSASPGGYPTGDNQDLHPCDF